MLKTEQQATLTGNLSELLEAVTSHDWADSIANALAGRDNPNSEFRIPAADTGKEIFFYNRELLTRFASISQPVQAAFLQAVRTTMDSEDVDLMHVIVPWTATKTRTVQIKRFGLHRAFLDFRLL